MRDHNPLKNVTAVMSRASQMNDVITRPIREAQQAMIDNIIRLTREAEQAMIDNITRPTRVAQQAVTDSITRPTREAQQAMIDSITRSTREAQQAMIANIAPRVPVFSPGVYLPSMSAAFNQESIRAINRLRVFADLGPTIDMIEQLRSTSDLRAERESPILWREDTTCAACFDVFLVGSATMLF